jgi:hypothetical protein
MKSLSLIQALTLFMELHNSEGREIANVEEERAMGNHLT